MTLLFECWRLLFPWTGAAKVARGRLVAHVLGWAMLGAAAWWMSRAWGWQERLVSPWPWLPMAWAPLLVLLIYGAGTLFTGLQRQAIVAPPVSRFADIDDAWQVALAALEQARIDPAFVPIFLVLGKPTHGIRALGDAASVNVVVPPTPRAPEAPFCLTASREAVFVWCGTLTALGSSGLANAGYAQQRHRFESLLRRLAALREPYCPINGILAHVPYAAAGNDAGAELAAEQCRRDVQQVRAVLGMECPVTLLVGDVQDDPGFRELLNRLSEAERWQALGRRLPSAPDVDPHEVGQLLADGVASFCRQRLPGLVYDHLKWDDPTTDRNARLVGWLADMHARADRFGAWARALAPDDPDAPPLITGCFFAATGPDAMTQGCVGGVFKTLLDHQDQVAWAPEVLHNAALFRRWTRWALGSAGVAAAAVLGLALIG